MTERAIPRNRRLLRLQAARRRLRDCNPRNPHDIVEVLGDVIDILDEELSS
jgi:hypothetical protein